MGVCDKSYITDYDFELIGKRLFYDLNHRCMHMEFLCIQRSG